MENQIEYFTRQGKAVSKVSILSGKPFTFEPRVCSRCGGEGGSVAWAHTGYTCYDCGGSGKHKNGPLRVPLYTAEKLAKLNAAAEKRQAKKAAAAEVARQKAEAEAKAREGEFLAKFGGLLAKAAPYAARSGFVADVIAKAKERNMLSEKQAEALARVVEKMEAEDARKATAGWVGKVGERLKSLKVKVVKRAVLGKGDYYEPLYYIVTMHTEAGEALVYKGGAFGPEPGVERVIDATVKEHNEYRGEKQTIVARIVKHEIKEENNV